MIQENGEIVPVRDEAAGLEGWVAIDRTVRGQSSGGLRVSPTVDAGELARLARVMTLKYGFLGMPKGGAKAGIRFDPEGDPDRVLDLLARFGRAIRPLIETRRYVPGPDMGTDEERIRHVIGAAGLRKSEGKTWRWAGQGRFTAAGVVGAFEAAIRKTGGTDGTTIAIEGMGAVGGSAARLLARRGYRVVAIANRDGRIHDDRGIDVEEWNAFAARVGPRRIAEFPGAKPISARDFLRLPVTAFLPCAVTDTIRAGDAPEFGAKLVVPGANLPVEPEARPLLEARGIVVLPDFVTNAGGVLGGALEYGGASADDAARFVTGAIGDAVSALLDRAARDGVSPTILAERAASARFERVSRAAAGRTALVLLRLRRHGLLPRPLARALAVAYAKRVAARIRDFSN